MPLSAASLCECKASVKDTNRKKRKVDTGVAYEPAVNFPLFDLVGMWAMSKRIQVPTQEPISIVFWGSWVGRLVGGFFFSSSHTHWSTEDHYTSFKCRLHRCLVCCELTFILICLHLIAHLASCTMHAFSFKI